MILYLVFDKKNKTCTAPTLADDISEAQQALLSINPENIDDLIIHTLTPIHSFLDLFLLDINQNKSLPDFLITRSDDNIVDPTSDSALDTIYE